MNIATIDFSKLTADEKNFGIMMKMRQGKRLELLRSRISSDILFSKQIGTSSEKPIRERIRFF
jgi:hypothetical protein